MARVLRVAVAIQHTLGLLQKARRCIARPYDRLRRLADHRVAAIARAVIPHDLDTGLRLAERYAETGTGQLVGTGEFGLALIGAARVIDRLRVPAAAPDSVDRHVVVRILERKSTRLNSSH